MKVSKFEKRIKIGVFSPAASTRKSRRYLRAFNFLSEHDLDIIEGDLIQNNYHYCSGTIEERARELNLLIHSDCDILYATIGGLNSASLLPLINYDFLKTNPKIFVGNSDISSILSALYTKARQGCYYFMTLIPAFGEFGYFLDENYRLFCDLILKGSNRYDYVIPELWTDDWVNWDEYEREKVVNRNKWLSLSHGKTEGILVGGNFSTLVKLCGTQYLYDFTDKILFLEDTSINAAELESNVAIFKQNGVFDKIKGLIICKCEKYNDLGTGKKFSEWFANFLSEYSFPILGEFDCGHTHPCLPMLIGGNYVLEVSKSKTGVYLRNEK